jgi:hypothetical protein
METLKIALSKFCGLIDEIAEKDPSFIAFDNYDDYLEACKQLGISPSSNIVAYLESVER